ncbi:uncharacterized protein C8A04DRAFT_12015 [Dichotomopilus funicola]|uniref:Small ribosomal subunit protein uS10m n=1 Tax=Dichotomopilus funicola TaxID=1934379 RepID=A0AAN6ZMZ0_9PEZI|nr:hypothetical protein C8A04DRAFT_12015 [Dichotomopilus funicola]
MAAALGLPDDEIDRLLSQAETRLSGIGSVDTVAIATAPAAGTVAPVAASLAPAAGEQAAALEKKSEKLSVRVPQLAQKQKGPKDTLGADWFNLPRTNLTPELKRDLQALRMRDVAAMGKQFFKKDSRKGLVPEYSQVGTIVAGPTDGARNRLTRKERKQTIVEELMAASNTNKLKSNHAEMSTPRLMRPLRPLLQRQLPLTTPRLAPTTPPRVSAQLRTYASVAEANENSDDVSSKPRVSRMPRALEALYLQPLRREAEFGVPSCDLQLRSYSLRNLEFFCDFALRAAYFCGLPAFGPVPLPRMVERWTVPKSTFIFKKSQENFERITMRRLIQIRDGHPETVQLWLAFLQRHAYYGIGLKANVWEFSKLSIGKEMDNRFKETEKLLEEKWEHLNFVERRPKDPSEKTTTPENRLAPEDVAEYMARRRRELTGGRTRANESRIGNATGLPEAPGSLIASATGDGSNPSSQLSAAYKVIFSGIQPTGIPHLGNYVGALREWKRLQDRAGPGTKLLFCIVDMHALTSPRPAEELKKGRLEMLASLLAIGIDPKKSTIFFQSSVPAHTELQWILSCTASTGYLSRMTQWKVINHGAADILLYQTTHVPVGDDQRQHVEFTRECATNFNHAYKMRCLIPPNTMSTISRRIMSLTDPLKKMSKSDLSGKTRISIIDTPDQITRKINRVRTDNFPTIQYDPINRPGAANLIRIMAAFDPKGRTVDQLGEEMTGKKYSELKDVVTPLVIDGLAGLSERYEHFISDPEKLLDIARAGGVVARAMADETMRQVRELVGTTPV